MLFLTVAVVTPDLSTKKFFCMNRFAAYALLTFLLRAAWNWMWNGSREDVCGWKVDELSACWLWLH